VEVFSQEDPRIKEDSMGFRNATFSWSNESDGSVTSSGRNFVLRIEDEVLFKKGGINLIIGPTGSGKTSLLMALLGSWFRTCGLFMYLKLFRGNAFHTVWT